MSDISLNLYKTRGYSLTPVTPNEDDIAAYSSLVCSGMKADDVHHPSDFQKMIRDGQLLAWWMVQDHTKIAWCAMYPWHGKLAPKAWHLYGSWVDERFRRRGLANAMWRHRISVVPDGIPVTVSVQPGTLGSETLLAKFGFSFLTFDDPWNEFILER